MLKNIFHIALFFSMATGILSAQPCFDAVYTRGCAPFTVNIINCSGVTIPAPFYRYDISEPFTNDTFYTYTQPGLYTITQLASTGAGGTSETLEKINYIEVLSSPVPVFSLSGCTGRRVNVTIGNVGYDEYEINFGDGSSLETVLPNSTTTHTYPSTSVYNVIVTGRYLPTGCGITAPPQSITPFVSFIKPDFYRVTVLNQDAGAGDIQLTFTAQPEFRYKIEEDAGITGTFAAIGTISGQTGTVTYTINGRNTLSGRYCYRISAFDDCGSAEERSEIICSNIIHVNALNEQNQITWQASTPPVFSRYNLYRNGTLIAVFNNPADASHTDTDVTCGAEYCYELISELQQTNSSGINLSSVSATVCVTGISSTIPPAAQNVNSSIQPDGILLSWTHAPGSVKEYRIHRSVNGGSYQFHQGSATDQFLDRQTSPGDREYCYKIIYIDSCDNISFESNVTCPVFLRVDSEESANVLTWTPYVGWTGGILHYLIERYDHNNNLISVINAGLSLSYTDTDIDPTGGGISYRIRAIPAGSEAISVSYSNTEVIKYEILLFAPNAFTPDGDGLNDIFMAKGKFFREFTMTIYNRWGEVVFFSDKIDKGWDGTYRDVPAPMDAYAFLIEAKDSRGKEKILKGTVTLIR